MDQKPDGLIDLRAAEFKTLLERAAETGARRALHEVGLDGQDAAEDVRDLRSMLAGFRPAKQRAVQTAVRMITTAVLLHLMAGIAVKLKLFGPDALLVTDGAPFFPPCARSLGLTHEPLNHKAGERRRSDLHINTVNSRHERLKAFLRSRRGVATSYLGSYLAWYHLATQLKLPPPRSVLASLAGLNPVEEPR